MSSSSDNNVSLTVTRRQFLKKGGQTPSFVNDMLPTEPISLQFGPGKGTSTNNVGSGWLMGSKTLVSTPSVNQLMYQVLRLRLTSGTPNTYFALTHSRKPGTFDTPFLVTRGDDLSVSGLAQPIYSLLPGTFRVYALGAMGTTSQGKGSNVKYRGLGSAANGAVSVSMDIYAV